MSRALKLFFNIFISSLNIAVLYYHASDLTISGYDKTFNANLCVTKIAILCFFLFFFCFFWGGGGGTQLSLKM